MPKVNRSDGPSISGGTPQRDPVRFSGVDLEVGGATADLTVAGRVFGRHPVEYMEHTAGAARWRQKLAVARSGGLAVTLLVVGDSRGRTNVTRYRNAWPDLLRRRFLGATPGSYGLLPASQGTFNGVTDGDWAGGDNPWTYAGSVTGNAAYGVGWHAVNVPSGGGAATITYFGDKITVFYVQTTVGPTAATVTLDGTSVGPLNARGALTAGKQAQYGTHGNYGFHTLVVTPNDGTLILEGVQWFDGDAPFFHLGTVQMVDATHAGFGANSWGTAASTDWAAMFQNADGFMGGGLVVLDTNDIGFGRTPTQFKNDLIAMVATMDARLGTSEFPWIFCHLPWLTDTRYVEATLEATQRIGLHRTSVYDLAALRPPGRVFGSDLSADGSHPNDAGHIWIAEALGQILDPTPTTLPPATPKRLVIDASTPTEGRSSWTEAWTAIDGTLGGYDQSGGGATVGERRHRVWLDPGTYRLTVTMHEDASLGTVEGLLGNWQGATPTLTSCGTRATAAGSPVVHSTRLGTAVTTQVAGWQPLVIRKTSASGAIRFVQAVLDKTS